MTYKSSNLKFFYKKYSNLSKANIRIQFWSKFSQLRKTSMALWSFLCKLRTFSKNGFIYFQYWTKRIWRRKCLLRNRFLTKLTVSEWRWWLHSKTALLYTEVSIQVKSLDKLSKIANNSDRSWKASRTIWSPKDRIFLLFISLAIWSCWKSCHWVRKNPVF